MAQISSRQGNQKLTFRGISNESGQRAVGIIRPNQVWAMDIISIRMARGFIYLAAVMGWFTRRIFAWQLSVTLEAELFIEAFQEALARHGSTKIVNTERSSQFFTLEFIKVQADRETKISMDGKGAWRDNVFVERLLRTIQHGEVHLQTYGNVPGSRVSLRRYFGFYNGRRPHLSLDITTADF